jgi:hypothetical protein
MIGIDGTVRHFRKDVLHRENAPAVIYTNGFQVYYNNGELKSIVHPNRSPIQDPLKVAFPDGTRYQKHDDMVLYSKSSKYHNEHGPAFIDYKNHLKVWFIDGVETKRESFKPKSTFDEFDQSGKLIRRTNPDGSIENFTSDILVKKTYPDGKAYILDKDDFMLYQKPTLPHISVDSTDGFIMFTAKINDDTYEVLISNNATEYLKNGARHRDHDLPAFKTKTSWEYYQDGKQLRSHQALDQPIALTNSSLVNRDVLAQRLGFEPSFDQPSLDDYVFASIETDMNEFRILNEFDDVLAGSTPAKSWLKQIINNFLMQHPINQLADRLKLDPTDQIVNVALDLFENKGFWGEYSRIKSLNRITFVSNLYPSTRNYPDSTQSRLLNFMLQFD